MTKDVWSRGKDTYQGNSKESPTSHFGCTLSFHMEKSLNSKSCSTRATYRAVFSEEGKKKVNN